MNEISEIRYALILMQEGRRQQKYQFREIYGLKKILRI